MNKFILIAAVFLLTGCPGPMDPVPQEYPAQARLVSNQMCITVPAKAGDKIFSVQFGTESGREVYKTFGQPDQQLPVVQGQCLPTFDFQFRPGDRYAVYYKLTNPQTGPGKLFAARFSLEKSENGHLQLKQYSRIEY